MVDYDDYDYEPSNPSYCGDTEFVSDDRCEVIESRKIHHKPMQKIQCDSNGERKEGDNNNKKGCNSSKKKKQVKRGRRCPMKGCELQVVHLPRHLRDVHKRPTVASGRFMA